MTLWGVFQPYCPMILWQWVPLLFWSTLRSATFWLQCLPLILVSQKRMNTMVQLIFSKPFTNIWLNVSVFICTDEAKLAKAHSNRRSIQRLVPSAHNFAAWSALLYGRGVKLTWLHWPDEGPGVGLWARSDSYIGPTYQSQHVEPVQHRKLIYHVLAAVWGLCMEQTQGTWSPGQYVLHMACRANPRPIGQIPPIGYIFDTPAVRSDGSYRGSRLMAGATRACIT